MASPFHRDHVLSAITTSHQGAQEPPEDSHERSAQAAMGAVNGEICDGKIQIGEAKQPKPQNGVVLRYVKVDGAMASHSQKVA